MKIQALRLKSRLEILAASYECKQFWIVHHNVINAGLIVDHSAITKNAA